ncbi:hypothetical protein T484DRAFT_1624509 [Baffinella frigidus]|nr:hypothetical protein T484DRAFT_1624509 [Cryptophyta sp. CCMP2293]
MGHGAGCRARRSRSASTLHPPPSTLNPRPSTLNPQPSTLNPQPSTRKTKNEKRDPGTRNEVAWWSICPEVSGWPCWVRSEYTRVLDPRATRVLTREFRVSVLGFGSSGVTPVPARGDAPRFPCLSGSRRRVPCSSVTVCLSPEPRNPKADTWNPEPETRNPKPEALHPKPLRPKHAVVEYPLHPTPETRNPKPETRNPKPETRNPKPET